MGKKKARKKKKLAQRKQDAGFLKGMGRLVKEASDNIKRARRN